MRHITQYVAGVTIFLENDRRAMFTTLCILLTGFPDILLAHFLQATLLSRIHAHRLLLNAAFFSQKAESHSDQEVQTVLHRCNDFLFRFRSDRLR